nr:MAG TPA: hypothetical protein [Caudoviricetes sp.]
MLSIVSLIFFCKTYISLTSHSKTSYTYIKGGCFNAKPN